VLGIFAILAQSTLDLATKAGTLPMQVLLLAAVFILGGVIIRLNNKREVINDSRHAENIEQIKTLLKRLDEKDEAMTQERKLRIESLMEIIRGDVAAKNNVASAIQNNTTAIGQNTQTIEGLKTIINSKL
jgi:Cu/Ag efflux pump CusA